MPIKLLKFHDVSRKLEAAGFKIASQKGSHIKFIFEKSGKTRTAIVPKHKEISVGTLKSILRQAGISWDDFESL